MSEVFFAWELDSLSQTMASRLIWDEIGFIYTNIADQNQFQLVKATLDQFRFFVEFSAHKPKVDQKKSPCFAFMCTNEAGI